jgi:hypothetical protein
MVCQFGTLNHSRMMTSPVPCTATGSEQVECPGGVVVVPIGKINYYARDSRGDGAGYSE